MFLEIIVFAMAIVLGVLAYWRESRSNTIFRGYNAFINKKETQMASNDQKGFFFLRKPTFRILNALLLACLFSILVYYVPFLRNEIIQLGLAFWVSFIVGTYVASILPSVKRAIDNPLQAVQDIGEEAKHVLSDLSHSGEKIVEKVAPKTEKKEEQATPPPAETKEEEIPENESARDRMRRKGYLK